MADRHHKRSFDCYAEDDQNISTIQKKLSDGQTSVTAAIRYGLKVCADQIRAEPKIRTPRGKKS